jgi:prepilin-type N-terminal cleavage/methylation domain-containing protein
MLNRVKKAFTMVEIIVVIVILLAALAVPANTSVINKSKEEVAVQEAS